MRELIEPALKIMARTGLFLSVVAWVVSQWWQGMFAAFRVFGVIDQTGIVVQCHTSLSEGWGVHQEPNLKVTQLFLAPHEVPANAIYLNFRILAIHIESAGTAVGFRHWFAVSTFIIFNVALWWFYRKPREVTPCES